MGPKKNGITASTPAFPNNAIGFRGIVDSSGPSSIEESSLVIRAEISDDLMVKTNILPSKKPTTLDLLLKAIEVVGAPRKGASYVAILKWITNNKENVVIGRLKASLKKAVIKALESGILKRATVSKNATGLQGYFMFNKDSLKKQIQSKTSTKKTVVKKNKDTIERGSLSDTEVTKKPKKRNPGRLNKSLTEDGGRKKMVPKVNANILGMKKTITKIVKVKAPSVLASKAKNVLDSKTKNAPAPKVKNAQGRKAKTTVASILEPEVATKSKLKTKVAPISKSKTKPVVAKKMLEKVEPILKPKMVRSKTNEIVEDAIPEETEMLDVKKAPKVKNVPASKVKSAPVRKAKTTVASTSEPESEISSTSATESEIIPFLESKFAPVSKSKAKTVVAKEILEETEPRPKTKILKTKTKEMVAEEEPEMMVSEKSKNKVALKPSKNNIPRNKKLYTTRMDPVTNMSRKDLSDTELAVKPVNRKSLKSYSSDTEIDAVKKQIATKATRKLKIADRKKFASEVSEAGPSKPKATKKQKAKNTTYNT